MDEEYVLEGVNVSDALSVDVIEDVNVFLEETVELGHVVVVFVVFEVEVPEVLTVDVFELDEVFVCDWLDVVVLLILKLAVSLSESLRLNDNLGEDVIVFVPFEVTVVRGDNVEVLL